MVTGQTSFSKLLLKTNVLEDCGIFKALSLETASFKLSYFKFLCTFPSTTPDAYKCIATYYDCFFLFNF
jgi:hypothetical protein